VYEKVFMSSLNRISAKKDCGEFWSYVKAPVIFVAFLLCNLSKAMARATVSEADVP